jgi:hypothetical protein
MDNLNFNDNYNSTPRFGNVSSSTDANKSFMVEFMIKKGIVKDEKTGNMILTTFAVILLIISGYIMKNTLYPSASVVENETTPVESQDIVDTDINQ